ncbi:SDR family oxidoreductase [Embleya scabrispora]|uniref:SDR family oxidoreductase n=1 Tax=Embleya scabrispora TaxID=159449 RepID=UPI00036EF8B8|nr:NAD(P)H-binding protein [Embleya scabrispora]MYS80241.1 NAD(P)H-binding protein [Streptomyces sp. SID5474]
MTILVTGARGSVARGVITRLVAAGRSVRIASSDPTELEPTAGVEAVRLSLREPDNAAEVLRDVTSVFLYAEAAGIADFVKAAQAADVRHIVLLSSASTNAPDPQSNPLAASHHAVEVAVTESEIPYTVLRPGAFAGNAIGWKYQLMGGGSIQLPYPNAQVAPIHEEDIADVATAILLAGDHLGETLDLNGPESLSFVEQIAILVDVLGRELPFTEVTRDEALAGLTRHMQPGYANALLDLWESAVDPEPISGTTEAITGKPGRTFRAWAHDHREDFADGDGQRG